MSSATICKTIFLSVSEVINENVFTMYSPRGRGGESRKSGTSQLALRRLRDLAPQTGRSPFLLSNLPTTAPPRGAIPNSYVCQGTYQRIKGQRLRRRKGGGSVVGESTSHCMEPAGSHDKERKAAMPTCPWRMKNIASRQSAPSTTETHPFSVFYSGRNPYVSLRRPVTSCFSLAVPLFLGC